MNPPPLLRWIFSVLVILSLVLAVDYFFLHILLPIKRQNQTATLDLPHQKREKFFSNSATSSKVANNSFSACLKELPIDHEEMRSPKDLMETLRTKNLLVESFTVAKVLKYQKSIDEEYEIQIQYLEGGENSPVDLIFLKKDSQGKSIPVDKIDGFVKNLEKSKVEEIEKSDLISNRKIKNKAILKNGWSLETWLENNEPVSMLLKTSTKILSCRGLVCVCR